jgi:hypothetical protein
MRLTPVPCSFALGVLALATPALANQTSASLTVGGAGSYSSEGTFDPGMLSDGVTVGIAHLTFAFDDVAGTLAVTVSNVSPVIPGVCNPVVSDFFFNTPVQVTGMTLSNITWASGAMPLQTLTFDADLGSAPNPNGAGPFGAFNAALEHNGIQGGIANPAADTLPGPPNSQAIGPAVFTFQLSGPLAGLTATDFTAAFSVTPPGNMPSHAVAHFQGGGVNCSASAFISGGAEECFAIVGSTSTGGTFTSPFASGHVFGALLQPRVYRGVTMESPLMIRLPPLNAAHRVWNLDGTPGPIAGTRMFVQVVMWNPDVFPANPEQSSVGIEIEIWSDGTYSATPYGTPDGMNLHSEVLNLPDGRRYLKLPFTIEGF